MGPDNPRSNEKVTDVRIGFEQHRRGKKHVVDPDDPLLVQLDVVEERRASVEREVQRVMQIVVQIGARADDEIDQASLYQLDGAAAETRRGSARRQPSDRSWCRARGQHFLSENLACLREPAGVERLKAAVDELANFRAAARPIITNRFSGKVVLRLAVARRPGRSVGH